MPLLFLAMQAGFDLPLDRDFADIGPADRQPIGAGGGALDSRPITAGAGGTHRTQSIYPSLSASVTLSAMRGESIEGGHDDFF
jgi:hypothetical protein